MWVKCGGSQSSCQCLAQLFPSFGGGSVLLSEQLRAVVTWNSWQFLHPHSPILAKKSIWKGSFKSKLPLLLKMVRGGMRLWAIRWDKIGGWTENLAAIQRKLLGVFKVYLLLCIIFGYIFTLTDFDGAQNQKCCEMRLFPWTIFVLCWRGKNLSL